LTASPDHRTTRALTAAGGLLTPQCKICQSSANVPLQAYVSGTIAAWVESKASRAGTSRSKWIGTGLAEPCERRSHIDYLRSDLARVPRKLTFVTCALEGLLARHPDSRLRGQVLAAFQAKVSVSESSEAGQ